MDPYGSPFRSPRVVPTTPFPHSLLRTREMRREPESETDFRVISKVTGAEEARILKLRLRL